MYWWAHIGRGVHRSCQRETHTSWWTVRRAPVPRRRGHRVQVRPYPLPCQGRPRRNGPRPSPSMWGNGGVLTSMNHIVSVTQDTHAHTHTYTHICKSNETDVGQDALENGSNVFLEWWNDLGCSLEPQLSITIIIDPFC